MVREKDLRRLPHAQLPRVLTAMDELALDPYPRRATKLSGTEALYRVRAGDYRIIYEADTVAREVTIHYLRRRREAYRGLGVVLRSAGIAAENIPLMADIHGISPSWPIE